MDEASLERMASRVAGLGGSPDRLSELERLVADCRASMDQVYLGVSEGRLSSEASSRLSDSLSRSARSACEIMRSCREEIDLVLPRTAPGRIPGRTETAPR